MLGEWVGTLPVSHYVLVTEEFVQREKVAFLCCAEEKTSCSDCAIFLDKRRFHCFLSLSLLSFVWISDLHLRRDTRISF